MSVPWFIIGFCIGILLGWWCGTRFAILGVRTLMERGELKRNGD